MAEITEYNDWEHQGDVLAKRVTNVGSTQQKLVDYDTRTDGNPVYLGIGAKSLATSTSGWLIHNLTYNTAGNFLTMKSAIGAWDDRATLTYE